MNKLTKQEIASAFNAGGMPLSEEQISQFLVYAESLISWNVKANLISKNDESRILYRHFFESAALGFFDEFQGKIKVLDLGTGAGFPGIPLKIVCQNLKIDLLDSKQKKCLFLEEITRQLALDVNVFWGRAEEISLNRNLGQKYDIVTSRAVSRLPELFEWAQPYLKPSGLLVAIKGSRVVDEIKELKDKKQSINVTLRDYPAVLESSQNLKVVFVQTRR